VPELPEVETVVRDLRPHLTGAVIAAVQVSSKSLRRPWQPEWSARLVGRQIKSVERRGKWIVLNLDRDGHLVIHLGMTGQLRVHPASESVRDHTHLILTLDRGRHLRFRDVRRFGSAILFTDTATLGRFFEQSGLGPEPFGLKPAYFRKALSRTSRCLKAVLLDQRVVAGVGNIYADEALFQARLHPRRLGRDLKDAEADRLRRAITTVLNRAIEKRGSTIRDYVGGSGQKGGYQEEFRVYGRTAAPCSRCRTPIARIRLAGRSTHYCPRCQKEDEPQRHRGHREETK
jgi:formamidopyrimidine-DNA glycosylase